MSDGQVLSALFSALNIPVKLLSVSSIVSILALLTLNWVKMDQTRDRLESVFDTKTHFDFIVVGGGSAGSVVAYRLSENGKYSVLLLEVGGQPPPFTSFPMLSIYNGHLETDWNYETIVQKNSCRGLKNRKMPWSRGKMLGGTSNLNWMIYVRGHPMDFNNWAELSGDEQWRYENLVPYFNKMENYPENFTEDPNFQMGNGPLYISRYPNSPLTSTWVEAGRELGFKTESDYYNGYQLGFYPADATVHEGRRAGAYFSYIEPVRSHKNLKIRSFSHVTKDHLMTSMFPVVFNEAVVLLRTRNVTLETVLEYVKNNTGVLAFNLVSGIAFINTSQAKLLPDKTSWPNAVLLLIPVALDEEEATNLFNYVGIDTKKGIKYLKKSLAKETASILLTVALPKSRGTITLDSKDPFDYPIIDPNYFEKKEDVKVIVEGMKFVKKFVEETEAFKKYNAKLAPGHKLAACKKYPDNSDEYFECYARTFTMTHVIGVKGLRVADASAMPIITNGNINAPCMMLGEKVSQLILDEWERREEDIGAGSAGGTLAYRLSENGKYSVLLLEAGGTPPPFYVVSLMARLMSILKRIGNTKLFRKNIPVMRMKWPRGKLLGGTSTLNWMLYVRGHPMDYNQWAQLSGDDQWTYKNLLPIFRKMERYNGNFERNTKFHGLSGPLCISKHHDPPLISAWIEGAKELGYFTGTDYNAYQKPGFYPIEVSICEGRRVGTYSSYIAPARERDNLKIYSFSHVTKIEINDATKRATGVTYSRHGSTKQAYAKNEIIISAGAIGTPQLLMLSGLGPESHLEAMGIKPKVNLPGVGHNLQDHVMLFFGPFILNDTVTVMCKRNVTLEAAMQYKNNKTGLFAYNFISGVAFFNSSQAVKLPDNSYWPDAVVMFSPTSMEDADDGDTFADFLGIDKEIHRAYIKPFEGKDAVWALMTVGLPKSRGTIELASKDPFVHPNIDPKYFERPEDLKVLVETMQFTVNFFETADAWQKYDAKFAPGHKIGSCEQYREKSDKYFECYARTLTMTQWHPCCTAKFGKPGDPLAVLNSNLSVIGVEGLRVADASAMPVITNANINAPCVMLGEKVAELILDKWKTKADDNKNNENGFTIENGFTNQINQFFFNKPTLSTLGKMRPVEALEALAKTLFR
ncbi:Oxygen-dependent choline dehydrogenase, partial [Orchesella cincta]